MHSSGVLCLHRYPREPCFFESQDYKSLLQDSLTTIFIEKVHPFWNKCDVEVLSDFRFKVRCCACFKDRMRPGCIRSERQFDDCFRTEGFTAIDFSPKRISD